MNVSAIDSRVFRNLFGTAQAREIFSDTAYVQRLIDTETALARAEAAAGVIPQEAADAISQGCDVSKIDFEKLAADTDIVGYPVLPLVQQLTKMIDEGNAKYIHWGATTQDIMDTASMLQIREALVLVRRSLTDLIKTLESLSAKYQHTAMPGRTHLQHALPITFGYKCAVYLSSFQRHLQRLNQLESRCLLVQFGGAAGTLASLGSFTGIGLTVRKNLAQELNLKDPSITWHVARDNIAETIGFLANVGASLGKIALDIIIMSSNEFGEVSEPFVPHRGASSTMPQKRNPISSEVVLAASKLLRSNASLALDAMVVDFERASGPWHLEWVFVPESFVLCCGALHQMNFAMSGLVANEDAMAENLHSTKGLIVAEAVMMGLAPKLGRQNAHDVVYKACVEAVESGVSLLATLLEDDEVGKSIGKEELAGLCDPVNYMGCSAKMVDQVLTHRGTGSP